LLLCSIWTSLHTKVFLDGWTVVHLQFRNASWYWTQQLQKTAAVSSKCSQAWIDKSHVDLIQTALCSQGNEQPMYTIGFRQCPCSRNGCSFDRAVHKKDYTNTACSISARLLIVYMLVDFLHRQRQTVVQECTSGMQAMSSCTKDALKHADIHNLVVTCMHDF